MKRIFIALEIPAAARELCYQQMQQLKQFVPQGWRWESPDKIHLTLRFLGDTENPRVDEVKQLVHTVVSSTPSFSLEIGRHGVFPGWQSPRILWLGLNCPEQLRQMQMDLEAGAVHLGYEPESKPFKPHLTIARIQRDVTPAKAIEIGRILKEASLPAIGRVKVNNVILFESTLTQSGSIYKPLVAVQLCNKSDKN